MSTEQLNLVIQELEDRGLLIDDYQEVFGAESFDEVLLAANQLSDKY